MSAQTTEVDRVVKAFAEAWNRHDMEAFVELFDPDAEFVNVVGLWWKGRAEITRAHEFTHRTMFRNSRLTLNEIAIRFPVPDIAIARCRWTLEGHVSPDSQPLPARIGILVHTVRRTESGWRIVDSQNTDIVEAAPSKPQ